MTTILLTGFEPFAGEAANPSQRIVQALDGTIVAGHRIAGALLPVEFEATLPLLERLLERHRPALVLALGLAGGRCELSLERIAVNLVDARIPDNAGRQPVDVPVVADAPAAYLSTLPLKAMRAHLQARGIPAALSLSAGTYVCNQVFFALSHLLATRRADARGGFVHVPWLPEQAARHAGQPSMALETMVAGVRAALECALATREDSAIAGGEIC